MRRPRRGRCCRSGGAAFRLRCRCRFLLGSRALSLALPLPFLLSSRAFRCRFSSTTVPSFRLPSPQARAEASAAVLELEARCHQVTSRPTAAIVPKENPCCSCGLQPQSLWRIPTAAVSWGGRERLCTAASYLPHRTTAHHIHTARASKHTHTHIHSTSGKHTTPKHTHMNREEKVVTAAILIENPTAAES